MVNAVLKLVREMSKLIKPLSIHIPFVVAADCSTSIPFVMYLPLSVVTSYIGTVATKVTVCLAVVVVLCSLELSKAVPVETRFPEEQR